MKLPRTTRLALFLGAATALLSCAEIPATGPQPPGIATRNLTDDPALLTAGPDLLSCVALPFTSVTSTIGPLGGVIHFGPHTLSVPPGALDVPVSITAVIVEGTADHVALQPEGLAFKQPASLTLSYATCSVPDFSPPKRIAYTDADLRIRYYVPSVDEWYANQVTGQLDHFSDYAVAW